MTLSTSHSGYFLIGARDTIPLVLAAIPFGIVYGALAHSSGLSFWTAFAMSAIVFAGSAQFIAIGLITTGAALPVILITVFIVNLRHALYATSLMPHVVDLPQKWRLPMAFFLTDETFATVTNRLARVVNDTDIRWYYLGSALFMYLNWQLCTYIGLALGQQIPTIKNWGLDVAMVVAFIGIVIPLLKTKAHWGCAIVASVTGLLTYDWPHQTGLLFASICAIITGLIIETKFKTPSRACYE